MPFFTKDKKILFEIDADARQSNSQIAKKVGLSKQVVNYRISKLIKEGIITGFETIINADQLGYQYHDLLLKRKSFRKDQEKEFLKYLKNAEHITWFVECSGSYDYIVAFLSKSLTELNEHIFDLLSGFPDLLADYDLFTVIEGCKLEYNYLFEKNQPIPKVIFAHKSEELHSPLDCTDLRILELLDQNARRPIAEIAGKLNITPNIASYRIKKLKSSGVIQGFRTTFNLEKIGLRWHIVLFNLNPITRKQVNQLVTFLRQHPHCVYNVQGLGGWQIMADFHVKNAFVFDKILDEIRSKYGDLIKNYTCLRIPKLHKSGFFPKNILRFCNSKK